MNIGNWQDYRGKGEGVLIHLSTSSPVLEPNYETGTFGLLQCVEARARMAALNVRRRYFLFGTRYQGAIREFQGRFLIIGYMRLDKMMDARKRHVHKWMENNASASPECLDMEACYAFQSNEMNFYAPADCLELTEELMKQWGYKGKITRQMKLSFTEDKLGKILEHFKNKTPCNSEYQAALQSLTPSTDV